MEMVLLELKKENWGFICKTVSPLNVKCQTSGCYSLWATAISRQGKGLCYSPRP